MNSELEYIVKTTAGMKKVYTAMNINEKIIKIEKIESPTHEKISEIKEFLAEVDNEFDQPLSSRINLDEYVTKLIRFGKIIIARDEKGYAGIVAFYSNDIVSQIGFITVVVVKPVYRGQGIGTRLVLSAIEVIRKSGMKRVRLETSARNSLVRLYERLGFNTTSRSLDSKGFGRVKMEYVF
jgi:ribosomal protein S18 acetylase RimI-like enzyme